MEGSPHGRHARSRHPRPSPEEDLPGAGEVLPDDIGVRAGGHVDVDLDAPIPVPDDVAMVGSDLDGTLLGPTLEVGARSLAAIPRAGWPRASSSST